MASPYSDPLLDLMSYARRGPGRRDRLTPSDISYIARTVSRTPEVMVKVLSRGASDLNAVRKHLDYISRKGNVDLQADDGDKVQSAKHLLEDWDLELDEYRADSDLAATDRKQSPRLVHKVIFSMPAGTPPRNVLTAVQNLCREEFALKHRYAMALHTDEPHPHVHVVIKALSEQGDRLSIRKETLRQWRSAFARHLRALGVPANATHRYVRGETSPQKPDGIYRASLRGESTHMRARAKAVTRELADGGLKIEPEKGDMLRTRSEIQQAWKVVGDILIRQQQTGLARQVRQFADRMSPVMTEKETIAARLLEQVRKDRGEITARPLEHEVLPFVR